MEGEEILDNIAYSESNAQFYYRMEGLYSRATSNVRMVRIFRNSIIEWKVSPSLLLKNITAMQFYYRMEG